MADETFSVLALGARGWPRWLWIFGSFFIGPEVDVGGKDFKLPWYRETQVPVPPDGASIKVSYTAASWGMAGEASGFARPGDRLVYRASVWPWRKGKLAPA